MNFFSKLKYSLAKTRAAIVSKFVSPQWSEDEMERGLLAADFGPGLSGEILKGIRKRLELNPHATVEEAMSAAQSEIEVMLGGTNSWSVGTPWVLLMVGVNGAGKTTTVAKLANHLKSQGGRVLLAAADTFRAAAVEQLKTWGKRLEVEVVASEYGADPGSVAHDAIRRMQSGGFTHLIIDTAGRQHTRSNLMQELEKVKRVTAKAMPGAPHDVWLVVDAPTGGNALVQAREFHSLMGLTGVVVTKLDGSAKGGMVVAIHKELGLPIRFAGFGESLEEFEPFDPAGFAEAIFSSGKERVAE